MEAQEFTPYAMAAFGVINTLLGIVYFNMREAMREMRTELRTHQERFDDFKDREVKALNEKLDSVRKEVTDAVHRIELALADGYVKRAELVEITKRIDKASQRIDNMSAS